MIIYRCSLWPPSVEVSTQIQIVSRTSITNQNEIQSTKHTVNIKSVNQPEVPTTLLTKIFELNQIGSKVLTKQINLPSTTSKQRRVTYGHGLEAIKDHMAPVRAVKLN